MPLEAVVVKVIGGYHNMNQILIMLRLNYLVLYNICSNIYDMYRTLVAFFLPFFLFLLLPRKMASFSSYIPLFSFIIRRNQILLFENFQNVQPAYLDQQFNMMCRQRNKFIVEIGRYCDYIICTWFIYWGVEQI